MSSFIEHVRDFNYQWTLVVGLLYMLWCASWVAPRFGIVPSLLLSFSGLSTMWVWVFSENRYFLLDVYNQQALKLMAADSFGKLVAILVPLMLWSKNRFLFRLYGEAACCLFVLLNSCLILVSLAQGCYREDNACGGLIGNPSIGVSLMVTMLPIFIYDWQKRWQILLLAVCSVFASKSSVAAGLLAVYVMLKFLPDLWRSRSWKLCAAAGGGSMAVLVLSKLMLGRQLFNDSDRFKIWRFMMGHWAAPWNIPFGTGLGTYHVFSINLQAYGQRMGEKIGTLYWWNTLHNEPLQFLFECGAVGLVLFLATYFLALRRALKIDYRIAMSVALYGLYMLLNPALHQPLPALFGAWLFTHVLRQEHNNEVIL